MTTSEVAAKLVALCKNKKNFDAMQQLYADNIVSVEAMPTNGKFETTGKAAVIEKSKKWAAAHEIHSGSIEGPFDARDKFAVIFDWEVTVKATKERLKSREIAVYTVSNGMIDREEFFYAQSDSDLAR